jgi:hypothetical protein
MAIGALYSDQYTPSNKETPICLCDCGGVAVFPECPFMALPLFIFLACSPETNCMLLGMASFPMSNTIIRMWFAVMLKLPGGPHFPYKDYVVFLQMY